MIFILFYNVFCVSLCGGEKEKNSHSEEIAMLDRYGMQDNKFQERRQIKLLTV